MDDRLRSKLQKILALTSSPVEGEAQAAAAHLRRLLEAHNLDIADLEQKGAAERPQVGRQSHDLGKAAFNWKLTLAREIAEHYWCFPVIDDRSKHVSFIGRPDDVESLRMLYSWLIEQIRKIARTERRNHFIRTHEEIDPLRWQCGFGEGAARRLGERLHEERRRQESEAGTALVLSRKAEISDWLEEHHGYRIDGRKTREQRLQEERTKEFLRQHREHMAELQMLREADLEAYYRECPWERPEAKAEAAKEAEKRAKREERNRRRRESRRARGSGGWSYRYVSPEESRREEERGRAEDQGYESADKINLEPFIPGRTTDDAAEDNLPAERRKLGGAQGDTQ